MAFHTCPQALVGVTNGVGVYSSILIMLSNMAFKGITKCSIHWNMVMYDVTAKMDGIEVVSNGNVVTESFLK